MLVGQKATDKIGEINISGDIIPKEWKHAIVTSDGNADTVAIIVYARLVYWCRPGKDGKKKFAGDMVHMTYDDFREQCNLSEKQVRDALKRLEDMGLIHTKKSYKGPSGKKGTYKYFMIDPEKYAAISTGKSVEETSESIVDKCVCEGQTYVPLGKEGNAPEDQTPVPLGKEGGALQGRTKTKNNNKEKQKEQRAVGICPECGEMLYEIEKHNGKVFYGHPGGHLDGAKCNKTYSTIAEIKGYDEDPTRENTCNEGIPDDVRQNINKLLENMSIN